MSPPLRDPKTFLYPYTFQLFDIMSQLIESNAWFMFFNP